MFNSDTLRFWSEISRRLAVPSPLWQVRVSNHNKHVVPAPLYWRPKEREAPLPNAIGRIAITSGISSGALHA